MSTELLIVIGVIAATAAGSLVDWLLKSLLPENPRGWRFVAITAIVIVVLVAVAVLTQRQGTDALPTPDAPSTGSTIVPTAAPSADTTTAAPTATWPVSETGVEACHLSIGQLTYSRKNAELWAEPDPVNGDRLAKLNQKTRIQIREGPRWAPVSAKGEDSGWWFGIEILSDARQGWVLESSIEGCVEP